MKIRQATGRFPAIGALLLAGAFSGNAFASTTVPAQIEAEDFDNGGQGVAYHDQAAGNAGGQYRTGEDVDIVRRNAASNGHAVNNFQTGEWLNYTIDVPSAGNYEISVLASTRFTDSAYRIEVDNQDVSGRVGVADTGGWQRFEWQAPVSLYLEAGTHVIRVFADQEYFNFDALRVEAGPGATPYNGSAAPVPGRIEAETFDNGGPGVAYYDNVPGNAGGQFRPNEDVDIVASSDADGGYDINNFESGEWLQYTIDVAETGRYAFELRAATAFTDSAYRLEIDGRDVTGRVAVPNTSSWDSYQWLEPQVVDLDAGQHTVRVISAQQYFNFNSLRVGRASLTTPYRGSPAAVPGMIEAEDFDNGGEGAAYHDNVPGNAGGQHRPAEDVDIVATADPNGGNFDVNNFETGEWLQYTVDVAEAGDYDIVLRVASGFDTSAFRIEIDDADVSGRVTVGSTGGWDTYADIVVGDVTLQAGTRRLKVVADTQYFNLNRIELRPAVEEAPRSTPYGGSAAAMPGIIAAAGFDLGGEGLAYHDNVPGNAGGVYRASEDVDLAASSDSGYAAYDVNNFETGEWLQYTVNVTEAGSYDVQARVASAFADSALRIEVDGVDVSGRVTVPNTGGWNSFQWVGVEDLQLAAGEHTVRVVSEQQYFNMSALRIAEPSAAPPVDPDSVQFFCTFPSSANDCSFGLQAKDPGRAWLTSVARDGNTGILLRTEPGDDNVVGSGSAERTDLWISQQATDGYEGREAWWAHSIMFPDDYVAPPSGWGVAFDFHNSAPGPWQANFHVDAGPNGLAFRGYGGVNSGDGYFGAPIGPVQRNTWYDFVYHVRWSSGNDGFFHAWVNGQRVLEHYGPTLYQGQGVYLKLANYHSAFGQGSSIIHDRIVRGSTPQAVSDRALEGVLELVNGVLTPVNP